MENEINRLIAVSRKWASGRQNVLPQAAELRRKIILNNHSRYVLNIPAFRKLVLEEKLVECESVDLIKSSLMLDGGIFKSYDQTWLDEQNFERMTAWLSGIFHRSINGNMQGLTGIDGWIERLKEDSVHVVYSSGTSGSFSFVPREKKNWRLSRYANISSLGPQIISLAGNGFSERLLKAGFNLSGPKVFAVVAGRHKLSDFGAVFLGFRHGRMGNQALIEELAPMFKHSYFLYDTAVSGSALRALRRGARSEQERHEVNRLKYAVIDQKEAGYNRIVDALRHMTDTDRKVVIFGAPYQYKELLDVMGASGTRLSLKKGSLVFFGGGWKAFTGEAICRDVLAGSLSDSLGLAPEMVLEGYSMTEINMLMLRCLHGRFHIPPVIEPVLVDSSLMPLPGLTGEGAFGFLDPLALDYPGFIVSGDWVNMTDSQCPCGLEGPAITSIGRLAGSEIKGCGGIMGSVGA